MGVSGFINVGSESDLPKPANLSQFGEYERKTAFGCRNSLVNVRDAGANGRHNERVLNVRYRPVALGSGPSAKSPNRLTVSSGRIPCACLVAVCGRS